MKTRHFSLWSILTLVFVMACGVTVNLPDSSGSAPADASQGQDSNEPQQPQSAPNAQSAPNSQSAQSSPNAPATGFISGRIEFQGPPTPPTLLYAINVNDRNQWFVNELAGSNGPTSFSIEVPAGAYYVIAYPQDGSMVAAYLDANENLGNVTVPAGQQVSQVLLSYAGPQSPCQHTAIPASPDGRFASFTAANCQANEPPPATSAPATSASDAKATLRGTITYQSPPTPDSMLYFISPVRWYWLEVPGGDFAASFEWQVKPGSYQLIAEPMGSANDPYRMTAAYSVDDTELSFLKVEAGQVIENISVHNINPDNCIAIPFPASPDGKFPALNATC